MTRFRVSRTSLWDETVAPIKGATLGTAPYWDRRTFKSPEEYDAKFGHRGKWLDRGTDHAIERGPRGGATGIKRNIGPEPAWFIEVAGLDDLVALVHAYGDLILGVDDNGTPTIEVYDGWRE